MKGVKQTQLDPLYVIFEQHLYNFQNSEMDRKTFIEKVVFDYVSFLRRKNIIIPKPLEALTLEELGNQIHTMLVKKTYGCLSIEEYQKRQPSQVRRRARARYSKLAK